MIHNLLSPKFPLAVNPKSSITSHISGKSFITISDLKYPRLSNSPFISSFPQLRHTPHIYWVASRFPATYTFPYFGNSLFSLQPLPALEGPPTSPSCFPVRLERFHRTRGNLQKWHEPFLSTQKCFCSHKKDFRTPPTYSITICPVEQA